MNTCTTQVHCRPGVVSASHLFVTCFNILTTSFSSRIIPHMQGNTPDGSSSCGSLSEKVTSVWCTNVDNVLYTKSTTVVCGHVDVQYASIFCTRLFFYILTLMSICTLCTSKSLRHAWVYAVDMCGFCLVSIQNTILYCALHFFFFFFLLLFLS